MAKTDGIYGKSRPHGFYESNTRPSLGAGHEPEASYVEGFSTKKNLADFAARASARSGPKFAPGVGKGSPKSTREDRNESVELSRVGWAPKRGD